MKLEEQNSSNASKRIAAVITEVLSPPWFGVAVLGAISFASTTSWEEFLTWWLLAASAIILAPLAFVLWGVRTGKFSDRYVMKREQRKWPFVVGLASMGMAIVAMLLFHAPKEVLAVSLVPMVAWFVIFVLTRQWKPSLHTATIAGGALVLVIQFGPATLPLLALVPLVGWARIEVGAHALRDVVLGGLTGGLVATIVFGLASYVF